MFYNVAGRSLGASSRCLQAQASGIRRQERWRHVLIDSLTFALEKSGCLDAFWGKLDAGEDATLGVAASARPFLVAARFAHRPQATLVVVAGEDAAVAFARNVAAYVGEERVLRFPERTDYPFAPKKADAAQVAWRMEAACALAEGRPVVVVASARALLRRLPPVASGACEPLSLVAGCELFDMPGARAGGVQEFEDVARALERRGYANTGELDGPGTFAVRGGTIDVFPGNLVYPVRLDFFGDELDEIRRIVPTTGQTIASLAEVDVYPVMEFACTPEALACARKKLARPALTNPALRDVLEKLEGGLRFDGSDVLLPYLYDQTATLGGLRARQDALGGGRAALSLRRRDARLRRPDGPREGDERGVGRAVRRAFRTGLRIGPARHLRVHHARGRVDGRRAAREARGRGGTSRQAVRQAAQPGGGRLHRGVQRPELPRPPGHEARAGGQRHPHPGNARRA